MSAYCFERLDRDVLQREAIPRSASVGCRRPTNGALNGISVGGWGDGAAIREIFLLWGVAGVVVAARGAFGSTDDAFGLRHVRPGSVLGGGVDLLLLELLAPLPSRHQRRGHPRRVGLKVFTVLATQILEALCRARALATP